MTEKWQYGDKAPAYEVGSVVEWEGRYYRAKERVRAGASTNSPGYSGFWDQVLSEDDPRPLTIAEAQELTARLHPGSLAARNLSASKNIRPMTPNAQHKRAERDRRKAAGDVRCEVWLSAQDVAWLKSASVGDPLSEMVQWCVGYTKHRSENRLP